MSALDALGRIRARELAAHDAQVEASVQALTDEYRRKLNDLQHEADGRRVAIEADYDEVSAAIPVSE